MRKMGLALLVSGLIIGGFAAVSSAGADYVALIFNMDGDGMILTGEKKLPAKLGATLEVNDRIELEKESFIILQFFTDGSKIKITGPVMIRVGKTGSEIRVEEDHPKKNRGASSAKPEEGSKQIEDMGTSDFIDSSSMLDAFASGTVATSGVRSSSSDDEKPEKVTLLSPVSYVKVRSIHPEFRWEAFEGAKEYRIRIFDPDENPFFEATTEETAFTFDKAGLKYGERGYGWEVSVLDCCKEKVTSEKEYFDVISEEKLKALEKAEEKINTERLMSLVILYMGNGLDLEAAKILRQLKEKQPDNEYIENLLFQVTGNRG